MQRCPECQGFVEFSFIDTVSHEVVYHCRTTGVPVEIKDNRGFVKAITMTLDHTDRYFVKGQRVTVHGGGKAGYWTAPYRGGQECSDV